MNKLFATHRLYSLKIQEGYDLKQYINFFNCIITSMTRLGMKINDKDKTIILLCSLLYYYDHLVTTLTYEKYIISLNVITTTLLYHSQMRQNIEEGD